MFLSCLKPFQWNHRHGTDIIYLNSNKNNFAIKTYTSSSNINLLGITNTTTLNQLIEGGLIPENSIVVLWINESTAYGREVQEAIKALCGNTHYGFLRIERYSNTRYLTFRTYNSNEIRIICAEC